MTEDNQYLDQKEMNVVDHLSELRNRLIVTAIFFIILFVVGFVYRNTIYSFFAKDIPFELNITSPGDIIWIWLMMAGLFAIIGTIPVLSLQIWLFVKPGLTPKERRISATYIPAISLLFIGGLIFGYFMFIKLILPFLLSLNDGAFNELFTVEKYFRFLFRMVIPFALLFEIPMIIMFLTSIELITPNTLKKYRKYAYFGLLVVAALVTPPDIVLHLVVSVPLFLLYELSIYLSAGVYRRKQKRLLESEQGGGV